MHCCRSLRWLCRPWRCHSTLYSRSYRICVVSHSFSIFFHCSLFQEIYPWGPRRCLHWNPHAETGGIQASAYGVKVNIIFLSRTLHLYISSSNQQYSDLETCTRSTGFWQQSPVFSNLCHLRRQQCSKEKSPILSHKGQNTASEIILQPPLFVGTTWLRPADLHKLIWPLTTQNTWSSPRQHSSKSEQLLTMVLANPRCRGLQPAEKKGPSTCQNWKNCIWNLQK